MNRQSYYRLKQHKRKHKKKVILQKAEHYLFNESAAEMIITNIVRCSLPIMDHLPELLHEAHGRVHWLQVYEVFKLEQTHGHRLQCYIYVVNILTLGRLFSRVARDQQSSQQISHTQTSAAVNDSVVGRKITNVTCHLNSVMSVGGTDPPRLPLPLPTNPSRDTIIATYWKEIAIHSEISSYHLSMINSDNSLMTDKCYKMLRIWLERITSPCWRHFIKAPVDLEKAQKHLQKSLSKVIMESSDTNKGSLCIKGQLQKSPSNVNTESPDTSKGSLYKKQNLQKSSVDIDDHKKANLIAMKKPEPVLTGTDTTTKMDNCELTVSNLIQLSAHLKAMNPLKDSEVTFHICDYNGGMLMSKDSSIKITVPKGAIKLGDLVVFAIATNLFASFILPTKCKTNLASPYYWIGVSRSYHFQKPIQVELEHYGGCNPSHYQLLCCEDDDESYTMRPVDYELGFKLQGGTLWCTFQAPHLCSYCLHHGCSDPMINKTGVYYLKPKNFQWLDFFTVEIWFSFPISHCSQRNRNLYSNRNMILDAGCSYLFEASCEESSGTYFSLEYAEKIDGWQIDHSLSKKMPTKRVNFYKYYTNAAELEASEEDSLFPPRFIVNVVKNYDCTTNLNTNITISLCNNKDNLINSINFKLFVPLSVTTAQSSEPLTNTKDSNKQTSTLPIIGHHRCDHNKPKLTDLMKYTMNISVRWKEIALNLGIPDDQVSTINTNNPNVEDKCFYMFKTWLDTTVSACWCHLIQAFMCT